MTPTPSSPAAAYLRQLHPQLPLAYVLASTLCVLQTPVEVVQNCLPDASEDFALGIKPKVAELLDQEGCVCAFLLDCGLTIGHVALAVEEAEATLMAQLDAQPLDAEFRRRVIMGIFNAFLLHDRTAMAEIVKQSMDRLLPVASMLERLTNLIDVFEKIATARVCLALSNQHGQAEPGEELEESEDEDFEDDPDESEPPAGAAPAEVKPVVLDVDDAERS